MKNNQISLTVNGQNYTLDSLPGETLADLLRNRLRLTGTKIGCNEAECGACTVLVDGDPIMSCSYPADRADGKTILTIEGLASLSNHEERQEREGEQENLGALSGLRGSMLIPPAIPSAWGRFPYRPGSLNRQERKGR